MIEGFKAWVMETPEEVRTQLKNVVLRFFGGIVLMVFGLWFLFPDLNPLDYVSWIFERAVFVAIMPLAFELFFKEGKKVLDKLKASKEVETN